MPKQGYDYRLRCLIDGDALEAYQGKSGDYFGWYEGEVVTLEVKHKHHTLNIKLDEKGNVSLQRHINPHVIT
jgi:hypothetical protein